MIFPVWTDGYSSLLYYPKLCLLFPPHDTNTEMHNPSTKVSCADGRRQTGAAACCFPLLTLGCQKGSSGRLCPAESWRDEARTLHCEIFPGLTARNHPWLPRSHCIVETACSIWQGLTSLPLPSCPVVLPRQSVCPSHPHLWPCPNPVTISELAWTVGETFFTMAAATSGNFGVAKIKGSPTIASDGFSIKVYYL